MAGEVQGREQDVPELAAAEIVLQLAQLVLEIRERAVEVRVVKADRFRALLRLARIEQGRQRVGHVMEDAFAALLFALDSIPVLLHAHGRVRDDVTEDVRMPPYELLVDEPCRRLEVAGTSLLQEQCEEIDLEEEVAELLE